MDAGAELGEWPSTSIPASLPCALWAALTACSGWLNTAIVPSPRRFTTIPPPSETALSSAAPTCFRRLSLSRI